MKKNIEKYIHLCITELSCCIAEINTAFKSTIFQFLKMYWNFPGGPVIKNLPCNAGDAGSIPG